MKVLLAEDDPIARQVLREIFNRCPGYKLEEAMDGEEAWGMLDKGPAPDFCVFDINMPRLDGIGLVKRMRADDRYRHATVLLCTGIDDLDVVNRAANLNVSAYITKPYRQEMVLKLIKQVEAIIAKNKEFDSLVGVKRKADA